MDVYPLIVLVHVVSSFIFILGHGVSAMAVFRVRGESDRARLGAILEFSAWSLSITWLGLALALVSGIAAAIIGGHFALWWPWASIGILVVVAGVMTPVATYPMSAVRRALGIPNRDDLNKGITPEALSDGEVDALRAKLRPELVATIGLVGLVALIWLMQAKPF